MNEENLVPGPKGSRTAGREYLMAAIVEALEEDYADDDEVRAALGKAGDFAVTDAAREALIARKAEAVYRAIWRNIAKTIARGEVASIKDFARFEPAVPNNMVDVLMGSAGFPEPIWEPDEVVRVRRTAVVAEGSWVGVNQGRYEALWGPFAHSQEMHESVPVGPCHVRISATDTAGGGHDKEFNKLRVTETGEDAVVREYDVGGLAIEAYGMPERVWLNQTNPDGSTNPNPDYVVDFITLPEPGRTLTAVRLEQLGSPFMPVRAGEYELLVERGIDGIHRPELNANRQRFEAWGMDGVPAELLLPFYPMPGRIVRKSGGVVRYVYQIERDDFVSRFASIKEDLEEVGAWPERTRNFGGSIKARFWPSFIAHIQAAPPPDSV